MDIIFEREREIVIRGNKNDYCLPYPRNLGLSEALTVPFPSVNHKLLPQHCAACDTAQ